MYSAKYSQVRYLPFTILSSSHILVLLGSIASLWIIFHITPPRGDSLATGFPAAMVLDDHENSVLSFRDGMIPMSAPGRGNDISPAAYAAVGDTATYSETSRIDHTPEFVWMKLPDYPVKARDNKVAGDVQLRLLIDQNGRPQRVVILSETPEGYGFGPAAVKAAQQALFSPATQHGERVTCWVLLPVTFALD